MIAIFCAAMFALSAASDRPQQTDQTPRAEADPGPAAARRSEVVDAKSERLDLMKRSAAEYQVYLFAQDRVPLRLQPEPALRWTNPVRGTTDGAIFIWLADGRPELVAGIYKWSSESGEPDMEHELSSLSNGKLTAVRAGRSVWEPSKPGIELRPIPGAPLPAESAALRLRQLRSLATEFTAFHDDPAKPAEELRLLPQPIYRYQNTGPELLDGALFVFVQATDPEVLLLIEASRDGAGHKWQYALARMTSRALRARHKEQEVWKVLDCWAQVTDRKAPYTAFFRQRLDQ
jgi:hypothetical protein